MPCDETSHPLNSNSDNDSDAPINALQRPSVKRHKLGTTTITNLKCEDNKNIGESCVEISVEVGSLFFNFFFGFLAW